VQAAAMHAVEAGGSIIAGRCTWTRDGRDLVCVLPGGRPMVYRNARIEHGGDLRAPDRPALVCERQRGRETTYGGKLVENITQAVCRDLLADALLRIDRAGLEVVLHVHDEIVCEIDEGNGDTALARMEAIMSDPPSWAAGLPIKVEGYLAERYRWK
jgi:DNA polymerase